MTAANHVLFETTTCSLCSHSEGKVIDRKTLWTIMECSRCHMMYLNPRLSRESLVSRVYNKDYTARLEMIHTIAGDRVNQYRVNELKALKFPAKHLDVGCGLGALVYACNRAGFTSTGIDINPEYAKKTIICGDIVTAAIPDHLYDLITMNDIVEHIYDVHAFAGKIKRILKPGGFIVAEVPNCESRGFKSFKAKWPNNPLPEHVQFWTPATFERLWNQHGLQVVTTDYECSKIRGEARDAIFRSVIGNPGNF